MDIDCKYCRYVFCSFVVYVVSFQVDVMDWQMHNVRQYHDQDTKLLKLECPAIYQRETFLFLYDFFLSPTSTLICASPAGDVVRVCVRHVLSSDNVDEAVLPFSMMKTDESEDDESFADRLRWFPQSRVVHEYVSSHPVAFFERMVKMIVIVIEVRMTILHRQVGKFLKSTERHDTVCISNECVLVMFRNSWRDYVIQLVYGVSGPREIVLGRYMHWQSSSSTTTGDDLFVYCREVLGVNVCCERLVIDYYSFGLDEVKKGTNVSRLKRRYKVELGPHVAPSYVPEFQRLYVSMVSEPIQFVRLQMDFNDIQTKTIKQTSVGCRGRRRRDPETITDTYMKETLRREAFTQSFHEVRPFRFCMCCTFIDSNVVVVWFCMSNCVPFCFSD